MSVHFSWQSAVVGSDLESSTKLVLLVIGTYMDQHGNGSFPSYATIAKRASLGRATVIRHIELAVAGGWLKKDTRLRRSIKNGKIENDTNAYFVSYPLVSQRDQGVVSPEDEVVSQQDHPDRTTIPPLVSQRDPNTPLLSPQLTPQKNKGGRKPKFDAAEMEVPSWLDRQTWADWAEDRKDRGKPLTAKAAHIQVRKLDEYRKQGFTPEEVIENSIGNGYQGLFPPNRNKTAGPAGVNKHGNFAQQDYRAGVAADGSF